MNMKQANRRLHQDNKKLTTKLVNVPQSEWPNIDSEMSATPLKVYRSRDFLVQVFDVKTPCECFRLTVNRTIMKSNGDWQDGITWDELQGIKDALYSDWLAVEIYPPHDQIVNAANMRHLWVLPPSVAASMPSLRFKPPQ